MGFKWNKRRREEVKRRIPILLVGGVVAVVVLGGLVVVDGGVVVVVVLVVVILAEGVDDVGGVITVGREIACGNRCIVEGSVRFVCDFLRGTTYR